ncbi:MAG: LPS assembly lipoprotein LptE [Bacteroidota bacterium]
MLKLLPFLSILFLLGACWPSSISLSDTGGMPAEWQTFSLQTLVNNAANAPNNYSLNLSEQIKDGIQNNTRLTLNPTTGKGEVFIEGTINGYSIMPVALQEGDNAAKNRLTISTQFIIHISAPNEEDMTVSSTRFIDYDSNSDLATVEANLLEEINKQIVQDVINKLLSNW